ncbi:MAG TPA: hypothetical protein DEP07_17495 [Brevibacillus sp.]|nr:hypothetical protein EDM60_26685 [Brevibacillus parabrevis]HBZ82165.1 hypothetical protein [Brevibacillus sp.]
MFKVDGGGRLKEAGATKTANCKRKKEGLFMDLVAILLLAISFVTFFALIKFCDAVVKEQGGKEK